MIRTLTAQFHAYDRTIFWSLFWCTVGVTFLYIYFLGASVHAVIARKEAESETRVLATEISRLESRYVALDSGINLEYAHARGFKDITVPRFVRRDKETSGFTLRDDSVR